MKILYGTGNPAKLISMKHRLADMDIELIGLNDLEMEVPAVPEDGQTPLENARQKAMIYYQAFQIPVFSCDSGLYFDNVPEEDQPGVHVRTVNGKYLTDEEMLAHYSALALKYGDLTARYKNAICLILDERHIYEAMEASMESEKFIITSKPHGRVNKGFPLDSLSIDIKTGKYYNDLPETERDRVSVEDGFLEFFKSIPIQTRGSRDFFRNFDEKTIPMMKLILEEMPGGFFIYHADGKEELIYANKAMLRIFGCDTEEEFRDLTGYTFRGMVYPEDVDSVEESIASQIAKSIYDLDYVEYRIIQKDGNVRWIEDYGHFLHTEAYGDIFLVFAEDATDRMKQRMHKLEKINKKLRNANVRESQYKKAILYDAITFFEINLSKNRFISDALQLSEGKIYNLFENINSECYEKYTDYIELCVQNVDPESLAGYRKFFDLDRLIRCYEKGELEQTFEGWILDAVGKKHLYLYILLLGKNEYTGDIVTLFVVKDITDQIQKQNLLQTALERAETANLARSIFLSNMSHDIRTPLNAIIGYTELIRNHVMEPDRVDEYNKKIRVSGEQLLAIVNESLEITRMESGKVNLAESECHLMDLLMDIEKAMMFEINTKSLHFQLDRSRIKRFAVIADYMRIKEILCQLLDNAVKYTGPGGNVSLIVEEAENDFPGYGMYRFIVEDDGIGISEDFISSLFDPFKRENNTTQSGVPGTGLGLTVVKNMVDLMKGDIEVESEPGKGSRFIVSLRLKLQEGQEVDNTAISEEFIDQESLQGKRILLVEDNAINMEIAEELLSTLGFLVETAENGSLGLEKVVRSEPGYYDLILMDIQMPVMDGHETARKIRQLADRQLASIPIIALSANAFAEDYQKSMNAGMNAHFPKPIDIHELQELIQKVLYHI